MSEVIPWTRVFVGWDRPVLENAAEWLEAGRGERPLDLSEQLLIVPTAEAGRRLKRRLAERAATCGQAVTVPHVWHPSMALSPAVDRGLAASPLETGLGWVSVLDEVDLKTLSHLVPKPPETVHWSWKWDMAEWLTELQSLLGAGGLDFTCLAELRSDEGSEQMRWSELARLEDVFLARMERAGKVPVERQKRDRARTPWLPDGVTRVTVLAAPDLPPLMDGWLESCSRSGLIVTIVVQAPEAMSACFDQAGRPLIQAWGVESGIDLGLIEEQLHVCHDPSAQVKQVVSWLDQQASSGRVTAIGVCDADAMSLLRERLAAEGVRVFEPGGSPVQTDGLWHLIGELEQLLGSGRWRVMTNLLRIAEVRQAWLGKNVEVLSLLRSLDVFSATQMPGDLDLAADLLGESAEPEMENLKLAVKGAQRWRSLFAKQNPVDAAREWLIELYGERVFAPDAPGDRERTTLAWMWLEELEGLEDGLKLFGSQLNPLEILALVRRKVGIKRLGGVRGEVDLVLQGWLELLWEDAPTLALVGFNEENVPGVMNLHPFLPDRFRQQLGLPCMASRFARDAYLLKVLLKQRADNGVEIFCAQWSSRDDGLKPSRLLMLCEKDRVAERVQRLFPKEEKWAVQQQEPGHSLLWTLDVEGTPVLMERVSASQLRAYLNCPYRYYLKNVLKMERIETGRREMDALQFGSLVHSVLKEFAEDSKTRVSTDESLIKQFFDQSLDRWVFRLFGKSPPPLVRLQADAARQRLGRQALSEARARREGWQILAAEQDLGPKEGDRPKTTIEGAVFVGVVDRIEKNGESGQVRIVDFKTGDKSKCPLRAHLSSRKSVEAHDEWRLANVHGGSGTPIWVDLQLPLYAAALQSEFGDKIQVAYGNMPKAVLATRFDEWPSFGSHVIESALKCAAECVRRIREGNFWPPNERAHDHDLDELFVEGVERSATKPKLIGSD